MIEPDQRPGSKSKRRLFVSLLVAATLLFVGVGWVVLGGRSTIDRPPVPSPNGYEELAAIGARIVSESAWLEPDAGPDQLRAFLEANPTLLTEAREALELDSLVPLTFTQVDVLSPQGGTLRQLARLQSAAGRLAEEEGRFEEAARGHLDTVRLGHRIRGGLLNDRLIGFAIESLGLSGLQRTLDNLEAGTRRELFQTLEALDRDREPIADTIALDLHWGVKATPKIQYMMMTWSGAAQKLLAPAHRAAESAEARNSAHLRLLLTELAIRAYRDDHQTLPGTLADLVPEFLEAVPSDPFGAGPLKYRIEGDSYRLYSVRPDGIDNDGEPFAGATDWAKARGDATLETYRYEPLEPEEDEPESGQG
ncbi:hypothetical protein BH23PLA1_BH23PLA1_09260 [soil metagenome]